MLRKIIKVPVRQLRVKQDGLSYDRFHFEFTKGVAIDPAGKGGFATLHIFIEIQQECGKSSSLALLVHTTVTKIVVCRVFCNGRLMVGE